MLRMLIALPPNPVRFPPERRWACGTVLCRTPVGPDLPTEARCRLALLTTGHPANFLLKYIDNLDTNRCSTAGASHEALEWSGYVGESTVTGAARTAPRVAWLVCRAAALGCATDGPR